MEREFEERKLWRKEASILSLFFYEKKLPDANLINEELQERTVAITAQLRHPSQDHAPTIGIRCLSARSQG